MTPNARHKPRTVARKYRDMTVENVIKKDAQYLLWAEAKGIITLSDNI